MKRDTLYKADQKNRKYGQFSRSETCRKKAPKLTHPTGHLSAVLGPSSF